MRVMGITTMNIERGFYEAKTNLLALLGSIEASDSAT
jgi:hypothetical protein